MEDRRYRGERDYSPRRMNEIDGEGYWRCLPRGRDFDLVGSRGREYRVIERGRQCDRARVGDPRRFPVVLSDAREDHGGGGGGEYDRMMIGDRRHSPVVEFDGREYYRRHSNRGGDGRENRGDGDGRDYDKMRVDDRRHSPAVVFDGREYDRRCSPRGRDVEGVRDGRENRGDGGGREHKKMRFNDRRRSPRGREVEVVRDREDHGAGGRECDRMRIGDWRHSPTVVRDGREYQKGRFEDGEYSMGEREMKATCFSDEDEEGIAESNYSLMQRDTDRMRSGKDCEGSCMLDQESPMFPVVENRLMDEHISEQVWLRRDYDRVPPEVLNRGRDYDRVPPDVLNRGRDYDRVPPDVLNRGRDYDRAPPDVLNRGRDYDRAPPYVARRGRDYDRGPPDVANRGRDYDRALPDVANRGRDYDRAPPDVANRGTDHDRAPPDIANRGGDYDRAPSDVANRGRDYDRATPDVANRGRDYDRAPPDVANRGGDYDRAPSDVANRGRDYDRAPPDVANRRRDYDRAAPDVANRGRDHDRASPDVANRRRDYDRALPDVANRGRDYDRAPPDVANRGRDYDRAPPDVANRGTDDDDGLPRSMRLLCDDDRGIETDNGHEEKNYYQFDDSLYRIGSTSSKLQNNMPEERWEAKTFRNSRELGVSDARLCNDEANVSKQSLDVGLLERFLDTDHTMLNSDSGRRFLSSCPSDTIVLSKHFGVASRGHLLTPRLENADHKHVDLHGDPYLNKLTGDGPFMRDRNTLELSKDEYDYIPSSSLSKPFSTICSDGYREDFSPLVKETGNIGSGGCVLSCGITGKPLMDYRHGEKSLFGSYIVYARQCNDNRCSSPSYLTLPGEHKSSAYQEVGRSEDNHIGTGSCDLYGNSHNFVENYCCQDMSIAQNVEHNMDRENYQFSKQDRSMHGNQQWDLDPYSIRHSMPGYVNEVRSSHLKKQDMDILDYGDSRIQYDIRIHDDFGPNQHLEYHDCRIDDGSHCHYDRSEIMRSGKYHTNLDGRDRSPTQKLFLHDLNLSQPSEMMLQKRHLTGNLQCAHQTNDEIYLKESYGDDELDLLPVSKKIKYRSSSYEKTGKECRDLSSELTNRNLSQPLATVMSKDARSSGRDIKSRLGPCPQNAHPSQSVAKKLRSSVKKRLGHGPNQVHVTLPWIKNLNAPKLSRSQTDSDRNHERGEEILEGNGSSRRDDPNFIVPKLSKFQQGSEGHLDHGGDGLEANEIVRKGEPAENSDEFKQLVHSNFLRFVKQLNETLVRRRKFMENGKCAVLKCLVCGRDSPEFQDTESLVMHALSCDKIGSKCQHLGFHKALCALMGWRCAEVLNDSWVCERLTDAETSALKDDLIIWPPVVVVHNITISDIPEKRIALSVEEFEGKLRDIGFGDKTKVTLGRPANQGTVVVSFGPSYSALQEAERLHKIFLDFNRGRTGVLQVNSNSTENYPGELPAASRDELDLFLYGYIGLADDLDKLDFEIKRRSLIKSRTEIRVIEDALIKKEVAADATNMKAVIADGTAN